jgi:hypothetical protein
MSRPYLLVGCAVGPGAASMLREGIPTEPPKPAAARSRARDPTAATLQPPHLAFARRGWST